MKMKYKNLRICLIPLLFTLVITGLKAESYDLKTCRKLAVEKSEFTKSRNYYDMITERDKHNLDNLYLPQFRMDAQATYQSEVTKLDMSLPIPNFKLPEGASKTQYQASLSVNQLIYEGGYLSSAGDSKTIENKINQTTVEVNNQKITDNVNEIYFNVLALQENIKIYNVVVENLKNKQKQISSMLSNGVVLKTSLESINIEIIKTEQKIIQAESDKNALLKMLAILIEDKGIINSTLTNPEEVDSEFSKFNPNNEKYNRPEYKLFENRISLFDSKKNEVYSQILPNISAFAKAGYGNPNPFNMLKDEGAFFYNLGLKFSWTLFDWSNNSRSRENLEINKSIIKTEQDNFTKNIETSITKDKNDIEKNQKVIEKDLSIITLQKDIVENYYSQFENGTITINDYLNEVNNLTSAQINFSIHNIQLLLAKLNILSKTGNY